MHAEELTTAIIAWVHVCMHGFHGWIEHSLPWERSCPPVAAPSTRAHEKAC